MKRPEVGDKVWYVQDGYPIGILVTVRHIDDCGDYDIDEPTGHDVDAEDLFWTKEEATRKLLDFVYDMAEHWNEEFEDYLGPLEIEGEMTLDKYRRDRIAFIADTQEEAGENPHEGIYSVRWPEKTREEYFTLNEAKEVHGMPKSEFEKLYGGD